MDKILTTLAIAASVVLEVILELKGVKVPSIVYLLSGFGVRHIMGDIMPDSKDITKIVPVLLIFVFCLGMTGCASYNQKAVCLQLGTTNASVPYIGGATSGSGFACYLSCVGSKCPTPSSDDITKITVAEETSVNNTIITSGPVKITATPLK